MEEKGTKIEKTLTSYLEKFPQSKQMRLTIHLDSLGMRLFDREHKTTHDLMHNSGRGYLDTSSRDTIEVDINGVLTEVDKLNKNGYDIHYQGPRSVEGYYKIEKRIEEAMRLEMRAGELLSPDGAGILFSQARKYL